MNRVQYDYLEINTDSSYKPLKFNSLYDSRENTIGSFSSSITNELSIAVISYNRLDKTKICIENLLKNTSIPFNLILIDSGSEEDIMEYYKNIEYENKTIIRITKNINANYAFWVAIQHLKSKYCAVVSNDVVVTPNAIVNLLTCLKSSNKIGWVSPVASNISNYQQVNLVFNNLDEMNEQARKYNISDQRKWCERLSLNPAIFFYRKECIDVVGGFDYGFFHDFADDEMARRINRAGYKTILCRDAWVHHDHIYNLDLEQTIRQNQSLQEGRKKYHQKYYNLDPLDDIRNYEFGLISLINEPTDKTIVPNILGVDVRCGTPIVETRNRLRELGIMSSKSYAYTTKAKYYYDLQTVCEKVECDRIDFINEYFAHESFDYILLGEPINNYSNPKVVLSNLFRYLKPDGKLLFKFRNMNNILNLLKIMENAQNNINDEIILSIHPEHIEKYLEDMGAILCKSSKTLFSFSKETSDKINIVMNGLKISKDDNIINEKLFVNEAFFSVSKS